MTDERKRFYKELEERLTNWPYRIVLESPAKSARLDIGDNCCLGGAERFYILTRALAMTFNEYMEEKRHGADFLIELLASEAELITYLMNREGETDDV